MSRFNGNSGDGSSVSLYNGVDSTSAVLAATANAVKIAYDKAVAVESIANGKASTAVVTTSINGLMSSADKIKLDGIAASANNYVHPANHPPSIITQDVNNRFVTDTEKTTWNAKLGVTGGTLTGFLTTHADPTADLHVSNKRYVDTRINNRDRKASVKVASTANIALPDVVSGTTTYTMDGITLATGDRVLLKNQTTTTQNGIYTVALATVAGVAEVASLTISAAATAAGTVTTTLNGVAFNTTVALSDTAIAVADKIRATAMTGWTVGGTAGTATVTFTSTTTGTRTDATYSAGSTGATGTMTTTTQGVTAQVTATYTRAIDADATSEITTGVFCLVEQGTANEDTGWMLTTPNPITVGTTGLTFVQIIAPIATTAVANRVILSNASGQLPVTITGNAATATKLLTARTFSTTGDVTSTGTFDGTANLALAMTLANSGVTAGTYRSVTVDAKGRVTTGTNPTTLAGYGITDAATSTHTHALSSLTGVDLTTTAPVEGNVLKYVGGIWKPAADATGAGGASAVTSVNTKTGDVVLTAADVSAEPVIATKNTAFNVNFGTAAGTAAQGNHTHGDATTSVAGFMSITDKSKLDGIAAGATNYVHPANHPPSIITQDVNNRFVTDTEKTTWNAKASTAVVTTTVNGLMDFNDKVKLNGIAASANNYTHPSGDGNLHVPATSTTNNLRVLKAGSTAGSISWGQVDWAEVINKPTTFTPVAHAHAISDVTNLQTTLDGKSATAHTHADATTSASGFMSAADKTKLNSITPSAIEARTTDPASPVVGQMWLRTDL